MRAVLAAALIGAGVLTGCSAPAANTPLSADEQKIGEAVRRYLLANPGVLDEVRAAQVRQIVESDARNFALGPANAPVTIVEFMDYRCGYCHQAMDWVLKAAQTHKDKVRIVFVDFPVLGEASVEAAQAVLAAAKQDKYLTLHQALMRHQGPLTGATIDAIARQAGVDVAKMRRDMSDDSIGEHLADNYEAAGKIDFQATPSFTINGVAVKGADFAKLDQVLAEQLKAAGG
jgi:protein-disulfide isomerase